MAENNTILEKLEGLVARFEEVSTLITDPNVIGDQKRYVKLTKEYKELGDIMAARKEYLQCLNGLEEAKMMMAENDPEMKEMAREEAAACEARIPQLEEEIKLLLVPADPQDDRNAILEIRGGTGRRRSSHLCRRFVPHVFQILRIERMEAGGIECQRRSCRRFQGNYLLRYRRQGIRHFEI